MRYLRDLWKFTLLSLFLLQQATGRSAIIMQPYLQALMPNSVYVLVECDTPDTVTVSYGLTTALGNSARTTLISATTAVPATYVHKVQLTGMSGSTRYYYQASQGASVTPVFSFRTGPEPGSSFRFAWMADCRTDTANHDNIAARITSYDPVFSLYGGDYCTDSSYSSWKNEFFLPFEKNLISSVPFFPAIGNHEGWKINSKAFLRAPASPSLTQDYYSFDLGDIHFLCLNNAISYSVGSAQYNFALSDLSSTTKPWKIVFCHYPAYCSGGHGEDAGMIAMTNNIFLPQGVDLVLVGHSHFYQHNYVNGLHHFVIGDAGAPPSTPGYAPYTVLSLKEYEFGIIDFTPSKLSLRVINGENRVIDSLVLHKPALPGGPLSGIKTIGPAPSDFLSLTQAMEYLRTKNNGINGPLVLELKPGYTAATETFPITFNAITGASSVNTVTIRPQQGATNLVVSGNSSTGTLNLNGVTNLIIDGRPGGAGMSQLTLANEDVSGFTVQFINDASNNIIRYCTIKGICTNTAAGVVFFTTSVSSTGNDNNLVDHCVLRDGATPPVNLVYSKGTSGKDNSSNTISNCELMNFSNAGIYLSSTGNGNGWTVSGSSFYCNRAITPYASQLLAIRFGSTSATDNLVYGNFIGGQAPLCGGSRWELGTNDPFYGIYAATARVENNKIANIGSVQANGAPTIYGIYNAGGSGMTNSYINNMIALDGGTAANPVVYGYYDNASAGGNVVFCYNSVHIYGQATGSSSSYAFRHRSASTAPHTLKNNILVNTKADGGTGGHYALYWSTTVSLTSDNNDLYSLAGPLGYYNTAGVTSLSAWQAASGQDLSSVSSMPAFLSTSDLHIAWDEMLNDKGSSVTGVTRDYDGNARGNPPDPGCDEFSRTRMWTGNVSTQWNDAGNWSPMGIPVSAQDILIPKDAANYPVIVNNGITVRNLTIAPGGTLTIDEGKDITVTGNLDIQGNGAVVYPEK